MGKILISSNFFIKNEYYVTMYDNNIKFNYVELLLAAAAADKSRHNLAVKIVIIFVFPRS